MKRLSRWWWEMLLRARGWPDPAATLDWLESRWEILPERRDDE